MDTLGTDESDLIYSEVSSFEELRGETFGAEKCVFISGVLIRGDQLAPFNLQKWLLALQ